VGHWGEAVRPARHQVPHHLRRHPLPDQEVVEEVEVVMAEAPSLEAVVDDLLVHRETMKFPYRCPLRII
jgi:hypothetical protein